MLLKIANIILIQEFSSYLDHGDLFELVFQFTVLFLRLAQIFLVYADL